MEVQCAQRGMVGTAAAFALNTERGCWSGCLVNLVKMLLTPHVNSPLNMQFFGNISMEAIVGDSVIYESHAGHYQFVTDVV